MRSVPCALVFAFAAIAAAAPATAQTDPPVPAPVPVPVPAPVPVPKQYKRIHQDILKPLLHGRSGRARQRLQAQLQRDGGDPETWFLKALVDVRDGATDAAEAALAKALELRLPPERILAGPRELLAPLAGRAMFRGLHARFAHRPLHGPMLGSLTDSTVKVWVRTAAACTVEVVVRQAAAGADAEPILASARTTAARDYTTVVDVKELAPGTAYEYTLRIAGGDPVPGGTFRTFPKLGASAKIRVAFGGGAGWVPANERMWDTIRKARPDLLFLLGDNVYIDAPELGAMQRYCYYRRQSRPEFRRLVAGVPVYTIWDDHDFGTNDCCYGSAIDQPAFKADVLEIFRQNWANPGYGLEATPGCFYDFAVADLYFMMLDGRYYRSDPKGAAATMLGAPQRNWVQYRLAGRLLIQPRSALHIVCSPVPWTFAAKGDSLDTWNGFRDERKTLFDFIGSFKIEGVLLLSADRHRSDIWKLPRPEHYPFYEFSSSRLTNQHVHKRMAKAEFSYNARQSFGLIEFDTTLADPKIELQVVTIDGEVVHRRHLRYSDLCYK